MPRYYFDITAVRTRRDEEGDELEGLSAARLHAVELSGEFLRNFPDRFWRKRTWSCSCRDESGRVLFVLQVFATESPGLKG